MSTPSTPKHLTDNNWSYMKLLNVPLGVLINFHEMKLTDGIHRLILPGANRENGDEDFLG